MPGTIADREFVQDLGRYLSQGIPKGADKAIAFKPWTVAVHEAFRTFGAKRGWSVLPTEAPYAGEYLCDFMLADPQYGIRVACESQWLHSQGSHQKTLDWAFDKLRGVKADVKVFVFEGSEQEWQKTVASYLLGYAQLSTDEAFLALHWRKDHFVRSWWTPSTTGLQQGPIVFEAF